MNTAQELERLRRWKVEGTEVIEAWEECYDLLGAAGYPGPLGGSKAAHVREWISYALDLHASVQRAVEVPRRAALGDLRDVSRTTPP